VGVDGVATDSVAAYRHGLAMNRALWVAVAVLTALAGWQYHRANHADQARAVAEDAQQKAIAQHHQTLQRLQAANRHLRTETDRLATQLARAEGDIHALLHRHKAWSTTRVPSPIAQRLRDYAATARGPPD
jgi:uncharacterized protein HemX